MADVLHNHTATWGIVVEKGHTPEEAEGSACGRFSEGSESQESAYGAEEFEDNYPDGIENHFWNSARNDIILSKLRAADATGGLILDIGCGRGLTLEYLREAGLECIGVEVGTPRLKPEIQPFIHTGTSAFDLPESLRLKVRTILLLDVIEHIKDSSAFLQKCRHAFPGLTNVLVTVPARTELWSNYDIRFGHYRRYNRRTLRAELDVAGFEPGEIGYFFHSLYPVVFYLSRIRKRRTSDLAAPKRLGFHRMLRRFFNLDALYVPRMVPGSSLIAVASVRGEPDGGCISHSINSLAVVVPAYNEAETLPYSHDRLTTALRQVRVSSVEIIYVNDGSRDGSDRAFRNLIAAHHQHDAAGPVVDLSYIELSRNFGHSAAVLAGLEAADADAIAIIDADLQDPPELISSMVEELRKGWDVVFGKRVAREDEGILKRATAWLFYRILRLFSSFEIPADTGDFRVMTRQVRDAVIDCRETEPFLRGLVAWVGFHQKAVPYVRAGRKFGETKYPFRKMARFATLAILSFSVKPLRVAAYLGALGFCICTLVGVTAVIAWALGKTIPGWTSLVVAFMSVQSLTLVIIGILGAYVGRIYSEVQRRPRHLIRLKTGTACARTFTERTEGDGLAEGERNVLPGRAQERVVPESSRIKSI